MSKVPSYPKRLIEVDLPIKKISAHAYAERWSFKGHISMLHVWWARRPLAACRAVTLAALWPDPADANCPRRFLAEAASSMAALRDRRGGKPRDVGSPIETREALLQFIADIADSENAGNAEMLAVARRLVTTAHESLGGQAGTRPLIVDPFAGGGAIPLEALRVGADAFASDLNPVAVLLNKVALEFIPRYKGALAEQVKKQAGWIKDEAARRLAEFYPDDPDGSTPLAYLWARTIRCEGPGCGAEVPLLKSLWLVKKASRSFSFRVTANREARRVDLDIVEGVKERDIGNGTVRRGSVTCPCCGYTTPVKAVREQFKARRGGAADARLLCVATTHPAKGGRSYRLPNPRDLAAVTRSSAEVRRIERAAGSGAMSLVPDEEICLNEIRRISVPLYGMMKWGDLFTDRQALILTTLVKLVREAGARCTREHGRGLGEAVQTCLALAIDRQVDRNSSLARWQITGEKSVGTFSRQAIPMVWDFAEVNPVSGAAGDLEGTFEWVIGVCEAIGPVIPRPADVRLASATAHPLPDAGANAVITDPPYYDAVPYAHLSDFFYVWLRRSLDGLYPDLLAENTVSKEQEIVVDRPHEISTSKKDVAFYEAQLRVAFEECHRVLSPDGVCVVVFASKTTASWEAILKALIDAGWVVTASWPIDTERVTRVVAQDTASLASSIHLVCRRRDKGGAAAHSVGDWRDVLEELPRRIHDWMPRLAEEGIVGADAIFACLGPALEIFSRYSSVETSSGAVVPLKKYLEELWAVVAKEALSQIFAGADAAGFEEDARLTAMWLWTLSTDGAESDESAVDEPDDDEAVGTGKRTKGGFVLEFDAARKIAQGLGAHLEELTSLVELKGEVAILLPVAERTRALFGKGAVAGGASTAPNKKKKQQLALGFAAELEQAEAAAGWGDTGTPERAETVLDRLHQAMILFGAGRSEALKRFLVDDGIGRDNRFWRLAQALSALYPALTDEKRWVDGVLARKKGLGF